MFNTNSEIMEYIIHKVLKRLLPIYWISSGFRDNGGLALSFTFHSCDP